MRKHGCYKLRRDSMQILTQYLAREVGHGGRPEGEKREDRSFGAMVFKSEELRLWLCSSNPSRSCNFLTPGGMQGQRFHILSSVTVKYLGSSSKDSEQSRLFQLSRPHRYTRSFVRL